MSTPTSPGPIPLGSVTFQRVMACVYGPAGSGKTVFACGSQHLRMLHLDVDKGVISAKAWRGDPERGIPPTRHELITTWPIFTKEDFEKAFDWFVKNQQNFDGLIIDTATELQRILLEEICSKSRHIIPERPDWNMLLIVFEHITRQLRNLSKHVIWVAHEIEFEDKELQRRMAMPNFQGQYGDHYAKHFDLILRLQLFDQQVREGNRIVWQTLRFLNCQRDQVNEAKDRFGALAKYEPPILDNILSKCMSSVQR